MRSEVQRTAAGVGEPAVGEGPGQERADGWAADRAVFAGVAALEQQRGGRVPDPLVVVVGDDERHCTVVVGDATDDHAQHVREFRAYNEEALGVGFRRHDVEQRDHLAAGGHGVLDEAVVAELGELLDSDAGMAEHLDRGPRPERSVLFEAEVSALGGRGALGPDLSDRAVPGHRPAKGFSSRGECPVGGAGDCGGKPLGGCAGSGSDMSDKSGEDRHALTGSLVHA